MKKFTWLDFAAIIIYLLPVVYLLTVYSAFPASVPMHYGIDGKVDRYGSKGEFLMFQGIMLFIGLLVYLLLKFLPAIDPKKSAKYSAETFQKMALGIVVFLSALNIVIIYATAHQGVRVDKVIFPVIGLLFAFMGNVMHSIKPNYFAGFKTPWTLESPDTWRATHQLAGKMWFVGGIIITVVSLVLPAKPANIIFLSCIGIMVLVPFVYSYLYFKKLQSNQNS